MLYDKRWELDDLDDIGRELHAATDYMEAHGWCRFQWQNKDGAVCILGALMTVSASSSAYERVAKVLGLERDTQIGVWNDDHCQSKDQAVAVLRAAATCRE